MDLSAQLPRSRRLAGRRGFEQLFRRGKSFQAEWLTLLFLPNGRVESRLGCVVGRIAGGAVQRNRLKRWFREVFRKNRNKIPAGLDLVVRVRSCPSEINHRIVEERFLSLCKKLPSVPDSFSS